MNHHYCSIRVQKGSACLVEDGPAAVEAVLILVNFAIFSRTMTF